MASSPTYRKAVGIELGGTAVPMSDYAVDAVIALAEAVKANAEAISVVARRIEGTPAVQGATISNCNITMGPPAKPKRRRK